ncbi:structure-specific endonuclease subunit SLX4 [Mastacembelus armatus]|uniref:structure-specific endonuclease subunit SLX4 n=1 Tax=Mastacembelus armatus TaxID=205130 RepID=UPI000E456AF4|nr:structure-specific endonuclease subunit SLX4 [Mastacembelus armatus]XP_026158991.1 structure-specific endonuclease subunit SLX4 [Mastacembelus armatus]
MDDSDQDFADLCSKLLKRVRKRPVEPKEPSRAEHQASSQASGDNRRRIHKKRGETGSVVTGTQLRAEPSVVSPAPPTAQRAGPSVVSPAPPTAQRAGPSVVSPAPPTARRAEPSVVSPAPPTARRAGPSVVSPAPPTAQRAGPSVVSPSAPTAQRAGPSVVSPSAPTAQRAGPSVVSPSAPTAQRAGTSVVSPSAPTAQSSMTAKDKILRRMQQFRRTSPVRMVPANHCVPPSQPQTQDCPTSSSSGLLLEDSDEALALQLQQELDREAAEAHTVDLEDEGLFFCQICHKDLSHMTPEGRTRHLNRCLDESEESGPAPPPPPPPPAPGVPDCPICGMKFRSQKSRLAHLKRCSSDMGVSSAVLLQALQRQAGETQNVPSANTLAQTGGTKRKGPSKPGLPARKKARKKTDPLDEGTMMALALSSSLLEQEKEQWCEREAERRLQSEVTACYTSMTPGLKWRPDIGKGRGKKKKAAQPRPPPLLLVQDAPAALMRLQERISALLLCSRAPSPPTPTRCPSSLPGWNGAAPLWQKSALLDEGSTCAADFYTPELREFIMPGKSAVADAAFSNTSNKPHSLQPVSEGPSCSQSAASSSPAPSTPGTRQLSVGSQALRDLMELAEDGMTLTQCGYAATGPDAERQSSAGASKNFHLSGFILEEAEEQTHLCVSGFLPETIHTHSKDTCSQVRRNHDQQGADKEQESNPSLLQVGLSKLVSDLSSMVNNPQLSDVQLQVDSGEVYFAHSFMVYARCPLLAELVHESGFGVKEEGMPAAQRVLMSDIPGQAVFALLQYLYIAHCSIPSSLQPHVLELASRFDLPELQRLCELHPGEEETHEHTSQEENNQTDQAFMELLRSMWNEEEEEDEEMGADGERDEERVLGKDQHGDDLTSGDREIREEKVNEEELEEIYEFAATQKKREEDRDSEEGKVDEEEDEDDVFAKLTEYKRGFSDKGLKLKSQPETKSSLDRSYCRLFSEEEEPSSLPSTSGLLKTHPSLLQKQQSTHKPSTEPSGRTLLQSSPSEVDDFSLSPLPSTSKLPIPGLSPGQVGDWGGGRDKGTGAVKLNMPKECLPLKRESQGPRSISASLYPDSPPIKEPELIVLSDSGEESEVVLSSSSPPPRSPSTVQNLQSYTKIKPQRIPKPDEPTFENKESNSLEFGPGDAVDFSPEVSWLIPSTPVRTGRSTTSSSTQTKSSMCRTQLFPKNGVSTSSVFSSPALSGNRLQTSKNPMAELETKVPCSSSLDHSLSPKRASSYYVNMDREDFALPLSQPNRSHHPTSRSVKGSSKQPQLYISTPLHTEHQPPFHLAASPLHTGPDRKKSMDGSRQREPLESPQKSELGSFHLSPLNSDPPSSCSHKGLQSSQRDNRCSIESNSHNDIGTKFKRKAGVEAVGHSNETGAGDENCEDKEPGKGGELEEARAESGEAEVADVSFQQSYMDEPPIAFNDSWGLNACVEANPSCFSLRLENSGGSSQKEHSLGQRETARSSSSIHSQTPPSRNYDQSFKSREGVINSTPSPSLPDPTTHTSPAINSLLDSKIWDSWDEDEEEEALPLAQRVNPSAKLRTPVSSRNRKRVSLVPITPMPHYSDMDTPELKNRLNRFAVRPLPKRQMILKLKEIHQYTHQLVSSDSEDEGRSVQTKPPPASSAVAGSRPVSCGQTVKFKEPRAPTALSPVKHSREEEGELLSASQGSNTSSTAASEESERSNPELYLSSCSDSDSDGGISASQAATRLQDRLRAVRSFIVSDSGLYNQILQYQPLVLSQLQERLKAAGIRLGAAKLVDYLDSQCITFTTAKPGNSAPSRRQGKRTGRGAKTAGKGGVSRKKGVNTIL